MLPRNGDEAEVRPSLAGSQPRDSLTVAIILRRVHGVDTVLVPVRARSPLCFQGALLCRLSCWQWQWHLPPSCPSRCPRGRHRDLAALPRVQLTGQRTESESATDSACARASASGQLGLTGRLCVTRLGLPVRLGVIGGWWVVVQLLTSHISRAEGCARSTTVTASVTITGIMIVIMMMCTSSTPFAYVLCLAPWHFIHNEFGWTACCCPLHAVVVVPAVQSEWERVNGKVNDFIHQCVSALS